MKKVVVLAVLALVSAQAHADGFRCQTVEGDLNIKAYNHTHADEGTRTAAILVLSDPSVSAGRKTIATFSDTEETLSSTGAYLSATVDPNSQGASRGGELISGTKIEYLARIVLDVEFSYNDPVSAGTQLPGRLTLEKLNGAKIVRDLTCERYLKN